MQTRCSFLIDPKSTSSYSFAERMSKRRKEDLIRRSKCNRHPLVMGNQRRFLSIICFLNKSTNFGRNLSECLIGYGPPVASLTERDIDFDTPMSIVYLIGERWSQYMPKLLRFLMGHLQMATRNRVRVRVCILTHLQQYNDESRYDI